jgi:hypothetical protein
MGKNLTGKRGRGRPKLDWRPFEEELHRRLTTGESLPTVEAEAGALEKWGIEKGYHVPGSAPIKKERIRERIKKRHGGSVGYQNAREYHLMMLKKAKST